ncbi:Os07g0693500 [Oryza sativa Japonica Group]|jgi:hypothetical protein|uniref:Os07g0693500 protein n=1 Tax=Oryza sativa subsp. japonica TaxID=39947 RepID=A0A0P0XAN6_ORYSJ|nr:hypothetical protein EE612_041549 [Oryza sativa]BAT03358.1 Os07g0693500 [Oryza sativa Japonica Group]
MRLVAGRKEGLGGMGDDVGVEEVVPGVGEAREAPVDAVGVGARVGLLLRGQQLALPQRVHRRVRVLAKLRQRRDVHESHAHPPHRPQHTARHPVQPPVRPDVQPP